MRMSTLAGPGYWSGIKKGEKMSDCDWKGALPLQIVVTVNGVSTTVVISEKDAS